MARDFRLGIRELCGQPLSWTAPFFSKVSKVSKSDEWTPMECVFFETTPEFDSSRAAPL